jgi:hypothetical protein
MAKERDEATFFADAMIQDAGVGCYRSATTRPRTSGIR